MTCPSYSHDIPIKFLSNDDESHNHQGTRGKRHWCPENRQELCSSCWAARTLAADMSSSCDLPWVVVDWFGEFYYPLLFFFVWICSPLFLPMYWGFTIIQWNDERDETNTAHTLIACGRLCMGFHG